MRKYVVDTNLYVHAARDLAWKASFQTFVRANRPHLFLHSTVASELLAGAITPALKRDTHRNLIAPFESTGRVITPTHEAWKRAGEIVADLVRAKVFSPGGIPRSFLNDCVIAASARYSGFTLITDNARDFQIIRTVAPFEFVRAWPETTT
ncbi:MAG TPA: type II toxin-antitoxin system VapC family toxin [Longimicrobium sp.]